MTNPKVSVIVPVYNTEKYLEECLASIQNQTLKDIEIICINDGSTDGSEKVLVKYANQDERIRVYSQLNSGQSAARNVGLKRAEGKYIYFMDSDDILEESALEVLYARMEADELDALYFDAYAFSDDPSLEELVEHYKTYYLRTNEYTGVYEGQDLMREMVINHEYLVQPCMQLLRKEYLVDNDLKFCEGIIHEDNLFNFCCILSAKRVGYIGEKFFRRRLRKGSVMTKEKTFAHAYGYFYSYVQMNEFFKKFVHLKEENREAALVLMRGVLHNARTDYCALPENEKSSARGLPNYERALFELYISDVDKTKSELKKTNEKLQQTYKEKSELNSKLQQTYNEKSELNGKLRLVYEEKGELDKKLQRSYEEKGELNGKLQQTYAEKNELDQKLQQSNAEKEERGIQIKLLESQIGQLEEQLKALAEKEKTNAKALKKKKNECNEIRQNLKLTNDELKATKKELEKTKKSWSFRIGRVIMWLPGKIKRIFKRKRGNTK